MKLTILFLFLIFGLPSLTNAQNYQSHISSNKLACQNKAVSFILNNLISEHNNRKLITEFIEEKQIENCNELFEIQSETDLDKDHVKEIIVRAKNSPKGMLYCGATGNCSTWILSKKKDNKYQIIFDAGSIEEIKFQNQMTNGYQDLFIRYHSGGMNHYLGMAKFDGRKYQIRECSEEITNTDGSNSKVRRNLSDCQ